MTYEGTTKKSLKSRLDFWNIVKWLSILLFFIFLIYPFFSILYRSFLTKDGGFTLQNYVTFFLKILLQNFKKQFDRFAFATLFSVIIGLPMAYITTRYNIYGKKLINILIIMSLMSPPFIGAYSWIMMFGRSGLSPLYSVK